MTFESLFKIQVLGELAKKATKRDKEIYNAYLKAYKDIEKRIAAFYIDLGLPLEDANKTWWVANEYNRLNMLKLQIEKELLKTLEEVDKHITKQTGILFQDAYALNNFAVSKYYDALLPYPALDKNTVKAAISSDMSKISDKTLMRKDRLAALVQVKDIVTSNLLEGLSLSEAAKRLQAIFGIDPRKPGLVDLKGLTYKSLRVARTEGHRVQEMANDMSWFESKDMGISGSRKFLAALDFRTREQSEDMDGQNSDEEGRFEFPDGKYYYIAQTGHPEWDINDRCTSLANLTNELPIELRRTGIGLMKNMSYSEYVKKYPMVEDLL
jgi:hypothetical protein